MWTLSPIHTGRLKASVFEVDPKVLSRNAPESIGESKHFTIASSLRGEVTASRKIGPTGHFDSSPQAISPATLPQSHEGRADRNFGSMRCIGRSNSACLHLTF